MARHEPRNREEAEAIREAAAHLDCDVDTVYRLIREDRLRSIRLGRVIRVPESALRDFIAGTA